MSWKEVSKMSQKIEFVTLAMKGNIKIRALCKRYNISPMTGYKWLKRYQEKGKEGLTERSRRPNHIPNKTIHKIEAKILKTKKTYPTWGGYKIKKYLESKGQKEMPSTTTFNNILKRYGKTNEVEGQKHKAWQRFEHEAPNDLWQMDFKGHIGVGASRCHPLTLLDDHSRYALCIKACSQETHEIVKKALIELFCCYGMPRRMSMDNGSPWGNSVGEYTALTTWLMRLGIYISHSRPHHPQTQGKLERFHRTLKAELLNNHLFKTFKEIQKAFDKWRDIYNEERPHQAIGMEVPLSRYQTSPREYPERLSPIEYGPDDIVRKVQIDGTISYKGKEYRVGKAFHGQPVALRQNESNEIIDVFYCQQRIYRLNLSDDL